MVKAIEDMGHLDNTLILYLVGDNGASAEGGMVGMFNEMTYFNGVAETVRTCSSTSTSGAGRRPIPHMAAGWAVAGNTPFMWTKQVAAELRRHAQPAGRDLARIASRPSEIRSQFHHVIDVAPTVLEAAGLPEPKIVNGIAQAPIEGVSMLYTFDDRQGGQDATRRSTSRSSAIARSTTRAG